MYTNAVYTLNWKEKKMKKNNLNSYVFCLFVMLVLCLGTAIAKEQTGICRYEKYSGAVVLRWKMGYSYNESTTVAKMTTLQVSIGSGSPKSLIPDIVQFGLGNLTDNLGLVGLSKFEFSDSDAEILDVLHGKGRPKSSISGERIVSFTIKKRRNFDQDLQRWTLTYKSGTVGWNCHADLLCTVSGDGIVISENNLVPAGLEEEECTPAD